MPDESTSEIEDWVEETSAFDRVMTIAFDLGEPRTAGYIAERAQVSEKTARGHLERLVGLDTVLSDTSGGATTYYPDPGYLRYREVRSLAREHDRGELIDMAAATKDVIEQYRDRAGVETYEELEASITDGDLSGEELIERKNVSANWTSTSQRLDLLEDAIRWYDVLAARLRSTD